ncbi:bifunctional diguanylate cyclase/phosphodiesterase [Chitinilyticum piscinae]|uniref:EAL domain-containing protein n=1 Tax=Chitinilyticum piscinae TaxID=2866724 RepID=A0A8J7FPU7_9NEIS|nr:EAL domain-containing protein [Chitinilyticum piscinae]MBE9611026.1 EAL domain-containing protein [Chitinilyticum piscinae]
MTLIRQLIIVIITLFVVLFAGNVYLSVQSTREFLKNQLSTISQDTATSLGFTLSPHMASNDLVMAESVIRATFDSGYYRELVVRDVDGKVLVERHAPAAIEGVPGWFVSRFPLETPKGEAMISTGWMQAGTVSVAANPGFAYATLWGSSVQSFWWFLLCSVGAFVLGVVLLHFVLRPLRAVESQAKAICAREYPVQPKLPWTLELRSVVEAMNRMTQKVRDMFAEQAEAMERLRADAYRDPLSGFANRRYFDIQLRHLIETPELFESGALLFLELRDLKQLNDRKGYQAVDTLIAETAKLIDKVCQTQGAGDADIARLAGGTFAILLGSTADGQDERIARALVASLPDLAAQGLVDEGDIGHVGIARWHGQPAAQLLAEADLALRTAQGNEANSFHRHEQNQARDFEALSLTRWRQLLEEVIAEQRIELHLQTVETCDARRVVQEEVLLRIRDADGTVIPAGLFIPMAKRLEMIQSFDQLVVDSALTKLSGSSGSTLLAINLFPASVHDQKFVSWLCQRLLQAGELRKRLIFEVAEFGSAEQLDDLRHWVDQLHRIDVRTSLDHFGKGFASFGYLSTLKLDFLKIDGSFIRGISSNKDNQFFVDALVKIAHGLDITVIAESVENEDDRRTLEGLRLDGVQGFGVSRPLLWE